MTKESGPGKGHNQPPLFTEDEIRKIGILLAGILSVGALGTIALTSEQVHDIKGILYKILESVGTSSTSATPEE